MRAIPGNRIVATLGPYKCYVSYTSYTPIQVQSTNETSKLWFAVHVWLEKDIRKLWEVML